MSLPTIALIVAVTSAIFVLFYGVKKLSEA